MLDKRPRLYAKEIIDAPRDKRLALLEEVPDKYKEWVNFLVEDYFAKMRLKK